MITVEYSKSWCNWQMDHICKNAHQTKIESEAIMKDPEQVRKIFRLLQYLAFEMKESGMRKEFEESCLKASVVVANVHLERMQHDEH